MKECTEIIKPNWKNKYKIIDNFLNEDDFKSLCLVKEYNLPNNESIFDWLGFSGNTIKGKNEDAIVYTDNDILDVEFIKKLHNTYHDRAMKILEELAPEKVKDYHHSRFSIMQVGSHAMHPIHLDRPDKLLTIVIHLKPEMNYGTMLLEFPEDPNIEIVKWKANRAMAFSPNESSWHCFGGDKKNTRFTLLYSLMSKELDWETAKEANKIFIPDWMPKCRIWTYKEWNEQNYEN